MGKKWWLVGFGLTTPATIAAAFAALFFVVNPARLQATSTEVLSAKIDILEPLVIRSPVITQEIYGADSRVIIVRNYLKRYKSVLAPHAELMVQLADKYDIDFRLLAAIAQLESNLCKKAPENSYNCWGFGIHSGKVTSFDSYPEAMEAVAKWLATKAKHGMDTPEEVMVRYNPPSIESGTGAWAKGVRQFMRDME